MRTAPETVDEWMDRQDGYGNAAMNVCRGPALNANVKWLIRHTL